MAEIKPRETEPNATNEAESRADVLHEETRQELAKADDKANVLLAVNGVLLAALLASLLAGDFAPRDFDGLAEVMFWAGAMALLAAEALLCAAVFPQVRHSSRRSPPRYFGDVDGLTGEQLKRALEANEDSYERVIDQLTVLAPAAVLKYRLIAGGQLALALGVIACAAGALLDAGVGAS